MAAALTSGALREVVEVWRAPRSQDLRGAPRVGTYVKVGPARRAAVAAVSSDEKRRAVGAFGGGVEHTLTHRVTLRAEQPSGGAIGAGDRLLWTSHPAGTRTLEVLGPGREVHAGSRLGPAGLYAEFEAAELDPPRLGVAQSGGGAS